MVAHESAALVWSEIDILARFSHLFTSIINNQPSPSCMNAMLNALPSDKSTMALNSALENFCMQSACSISCGDILK